MRGKNVISGTLLATAGFSAGYLSGTTQQFDKPHHVNAAEAGLDWKPFNQVLNGQFEIKGNCFRILNDGYSYDFMFSEIDPEVSLTMPITGKRITVKPDPEKPDEALVYREQ